MPTIPTKGINIPTNRDKDMSELVANGSKWTDDQRKEAAIQYAIKGNVSAIAKATGIPRKTISDWKATEWFNEIVAEVRHETANEHIARYHALTSKALDRAIETIDQADAKSAATVAAIATDKARLLLNQPTSIRGTDDSTDKLMRKFEKIAESYQAKVVATSHRVVDTEQDQD